MRIDIDKASMALGMILEGMSLRGTSRLTGFKVDTLCDLVLLVGENCDKFLEERIRDLPAKRIEMDELWGFIGCKARTKEARGRTDEGSQGTHRRE